MALIIRRDDAISADIVPTQILTLITAEQWHDICSIVKVISLSSFLSFSFVFLFNKILFFLFFFSFN